MKLYTSLLVIVALLFSSACTPAQQSQAFAIVDGVLAAAEGEISLLSANQQLPPAVSGQIVAYVDAAMAVAKTIEGNIQTGTPLTQASADLAALTVQLNSLQGVPSNAKIYLTEINAGLQLLIPIIAPLISSTGDIHISDLSLALDPKIKAPGGKMVRVHWYTHPMLTFKMHQFHGRMKKLQKQLDKMPKVKSVSSIDSNVEIMQDSVSAHAARMAFETFYPTGIVLH